ncbi:hypothetical protein GE09DRAFT_71659 [Coniochaeta sp. 2T2.1]|nr:hypothetical protein GE09DRAFT_71659 [Coniochaeta sp. 2T2.1]
MDVALRLVTRSLSCCWCCCNRVKGMFCHMYAHSQALFCLLLPRLPKELPVSISFSSHHVLSVGTCFQACVHVYVMKRGLPRSIHVARSGGCARHRATHRAGQGFPSRTPL